MPFLHAIARRLSLILPLVLGALGDARAQLPPSPLPLSNTEDARTLPKGTVRLRALNAWTRFDAVFGGLGESTHVARPLGDAFSASALGAAQLPVLVPAQNAVRTLTGDAALTLNVGRLVASADSRIYTTPITLEYGLTDRLTIGAMVPIVQTHSTVFVALNPSGQASGNVGPNPALAPSNATAQPANRAVYSALAQAFADLNSALAECASSPSSPICSRQAEATAARDLAAAYRDAVRDLYGIDAQTGSPFVPRAELQGLIGQRLASLDATFQSLLGRAYLNGAVPSGANGFAALLQFQQLATDPAGIAYDSLGSPDRIGVGDVELSAVYRLIDRFADTVQSGGLRVRAAIRGVLRLGTGQPTTGLVPFEVGTGSGQTSADGAALVDLRFPGRVVLSLAGQYTAFFGSAVLPRALNSEFALFPLDVPRAGQWRAGNTLQIDATPRILIADYFTINGHYTMRRAAAGQFASANQTVAPLFAASTEQRAGVGFAYSTLARYARGRSRVPLELFFSHLETVTARGGLTPKYTREQVELRIYYRLRRGTR